MNALLFFAVLLLVATSCGAANQTCRRCWGRGTLTQSTPALCECSCWTTSDTPVGDATEIRTLPTTPSLALLPPTCRYTEAERVAVRAVLQGDLRQFISFSFMRAIRAGLELKFDDQVVIRSISVISSTSFDVVFDIRDDGTGNSLPQDNADLSTNWAAIHYARLVEAVRVATSWAGAIGIRSVEQYAVPVSPRAQHGGGHLADIGGVPVAVEPVMWLGGAFLVVVILAGVEFSFSDSLTEEEAAVLKFRSRSMNGGAGGGNGDAAAAAGAGNTAPATTRTPGEDIRDFMDDDGFEAPPPVKKPSVRNERRQSQAEAYSEYAKNFYGQPEPEPAKEPASSAPPPAVAEEAAQRRSSMRKKSYYYV